MAATLWRVAAGEDIDRHFLPSLIGADRSEQRRLMGRHERTQMRDV
jgi:hypothetical protein